MYSIKGKVFEFFVFRFLYSCGFEPIVPDGMFVFGETDMLMVQGLGGAHNADVLMAPPVQIPCAYPIRLLVECKCYNESVGLPIIRNALGMRHDINSMEVLSTDILENREDNRNNKQRLYKMNRYQYQVAVAAIDDFAVTTFAFAAAHRIPLISFARSRIFENIRMLINAIDLEARLSSNHANEIRAKMKKWMEHPEWMTNERFENTSFDRFVNELLSIEKETSIGLLSDGTMLFLRKNNYALSLVSDEFTYDDGFTIHWYTEEDSTWVIRFWEDRGERRYLSEYLFELPKELYEEWKRSAKEQKEEAKHVKRDYFNHITLFSRGSASEVIIKRIPLSQSFIETELKD